MAVTFLLIEDTPLMSKEITRVSGFNETWNNDAVNFEFSIHDNSDRDSMILSAEALEASITHNNSDEVAHDNTERYMIMYRRRPVIDVYVRGVVKGSK